MTTYLPEALSPGDNLRQMLADHISDANSLAGAVEYLITAYENAVVDADRYRKLKSLALTAQTSKTFAISKFEGMHWEAYELSPMDLDKELDQLNLK